LPSFKLASSSRPKPLQSGHLRKFIFDRAERAAFETKEADVYACRLSGSKKIFQIPDVGRLAAAALRTFGKSGERKYKTRAPLAPFPKPDFGRKRCGNCRHTVVIVVADKAAAKPPFAKIRF